jgi:hypothetical protein
MCKNDFFWLKIKKGTWKNCDWDEKENVIYYITYVTEPQFCNTSTWAQCNEVCYLIVLISDTNTTYVNRGRCGLGNGGGTNFVGKLIHTSTVNHRDSEIDITRYYEISVWIKTRDIFSQFNLRSSRLTSVHFLLFVLSLMCCWPPINSYLTW